MSTLIERIQDLTGPASGGEAVRCEYCDGTGDVHSLDGEWRGTCTECDAGKGIAKPHPPTDPVAGVGDRLERLAKKWERVADEQGVVTFTGAEHRLFANELRAIIGTAPADGGSSG